MNRQAVLLKAGEPLQIQNNAIPNPSPSGFVVKTHYGGMCRTDVELWENSYPFGKGAGIRWTDIHRRTYPLVIGHEVAGEIYALGKDLDAESQDLRIGDKVVVYASRGCRTCRLCSNKLTHRCKSVMAFTPGMGQDGGYGAYVTAPSSETLVKVPDGMAMEVASLLSCCGLAAYAAVLATKLSIEEALMVNGTASLVIVGTGGLGLWGIGLAKAIYPKEVIVIAIDVKADKLEVAKQAGADKIILWESKESNDEQALIQATQGVIGGLFNAAIDCVGTGLTVGRLIKGAEDSATIVVVGAFGGYCKLPVTQFPMTSLTITGVLCGPVDMLKDLVQLVHQKQVKPPPITVINLDQANEYLEKLKQGTTVGRVVIKHNV